jgi:hypothetical protein
LPKYALAKMEARLEKISRVGPAATMVLATEELRREPGRILAQPV